MRLLHSNIRSFRQNKNNLLTILETFNPTVIGLNETHFDQTTDLSVFENITTTYLNSNHIFKSPLGLRSPPLSGTSIFTNDKADIKF